MNTNHTCAAEDCKTEMSEGSPKYCPEHNELNIRGTWREKYRTDYVAKDPESGLPTYTQHPDALEDFIDALLKEQLEEVQKRCPVIEDIKKVGDSLWVKIPAENDTQTFQILSQNVISSLLLDKS